MNLTALNADLRKKIGNPSVASVPDVDLTAKINEAIDFILDRFRFHNNRNICTFDTIASTQSYTLPTAYLNLLSVWDVTNEVKLEQKDDNWAALNQGITAEGKPLYYVHYKNWIKLYSVPDGVYSIRVRHKASQTALSGATDVPVLPTPWHPGIGRYARYLWWEDSGDIQKAEFAFDGWQRWLETKPVEVDEELAADNEQGVIVPTLGRYRPRYDFDHSD